MKVLRWFRKLVVENAGWKVISLLIATILWALVASEPELAAFATAPVEYKNLPDDLEISSEPMTAVSLELRGPSGELRGVNDGALRPAVILDMSGVRPGERTFAIDSSSVKLARGVRLVRAIPSEVRLQFDRRAVKIVPVRPRFIGEGTSGYEIVHWSVIPPQLTIEGPADHVARIRQVQTDPVDVSGVVGTSEFRVNAYVGEPYVRFQSSPQVAVSVTMKKKEE
jgi:YbbR domain-containing protein